MFRLTKLAIYLVAGYAFYEFYIGLTEQRQNNKTAPAQSGRRHRPSSGPGAEIGGNRVPVADSNGAERTQAVGRGVVS